MEPLPSLVAPFVSEIVQPGKRVCVQATQVPNIFASIASCAVRFEVEEGADAFTIETLVNMRMNVLCGSSGEGVSAEHFAKDGYLSGRTVIDGWAPGSSSSAVVTNTSDKPAVFRAGFHAVLNAEEVEHCVLPLTARLGPGETRRVTGYACVGVEVLRVCCTAGFEVLGHDLLDVAVPMGVEWGVSVHNLDGRKPAHFHGAAWCRDLTPKYVAPPPKPALVVVAEREAAVLRVDSEGRVLAKCVECGREGPLVLHPETDAALRGLAEK